MHDYEDPKDDDACVWTRVDLTSSELNSDAKWVQQSKQLRAANPHAKMSSMGDIMQNSLQEGGAKAAVPDFNKYAGKCGQHIEWREEGSEEIEVKVNIGKPFTKHDVKVLVVGKKCTIKVGDLLLADKQEIFAAIDNDETTWTLSGGDTLNISLFKEDTSRRNISSKFTIFIQISSTFHFFHSKIKNLSLEIPKTIVLGQHWTQLFKDESNFASDENKAPNGYPQ